MPLKSQSTNERITKVCRMLYQSQVNQKKYFDTLLAKICDLRDTQLDMFFAIGQIQTELSVLQHSVGFASTDDAPPTPTAGQSSNVAVKKEGGSSPPRCVLCGHFAPKQCPSCIINKQQHDANSALAEPDSSSDEPDGNGDVMTGNNNNSSMNHGNNSLQ